jgi:hypothetical protein
MPGNPAEYKNISIVDAVYPSQYMRSTSVLENYELKASLRTIELLI